MNDIVVHKKNHAFLRIGCEPSVAREISECFTFFTPNHEHMAAFKKGHWDGKIRLFNLRTHELPGGLYRYLEEFAKDSGYTVSAEENGQYGVPGQTFGFDMSFMDGLNITVRKGEKAEDRDYQLAAIRHCMSARRAVLLSPVSSGKSMIIYSCIRWFLANRPGKVLLVVPSISLVEQMYKDFGIYSEFDDGFCVWEDCHRIYAGQEKDTFGQRVAISTFQSIHKLPDEWFSGYGMVFGDEAHRFKAKSLVSILSKCTEAEFRLGTTGTLDGQYCHRLVIEGHFGPVYRNTTTRALMDSGELSDLDISVLLLKYPEAECRLISGGKKTKYHDEIEFLVAHTERNRLIARLALGLTGNTLVLFQLVEKHGKPLFALIDEQAGEGRKVFYVSGETDIDERERVREQTERENNAVIIASSGTFSTGINIRNLHNIIFASPTKSQVKVLQSIGRGLRKADDGRKTRVIDLADDLHWKASKNYAMKHAAERIGIYSREQFKYTIREVKLPQSR